MRFTWANQTGSILLAVTLKHGISIGSLGKFSNVEPVEGIKEESKVILRNISFKNIHGTSTLLEPVKFICSGSSPCQNVELVDIDIKHNGAEHATSQCLDVKPITSGKLNPTPCSSPVPKTLSAVA
ncbi:hypothetical protein Goarm_005734 [Gossypium armourianum]|uniref:Polygalacturonase-like n=1 Tax=Gossypium armourianum TaxID=34283 RepID=A0A7J9KGW7_9ROSI|nr:hypothetical protein [Gossypium armourianum]